LSEALTRRRFLAGAAGIGVAAALGPHAFARPIGADRPRIAIVGAGLAGLTCAYRLHQRGIACSLYEAHGARVGGRCWTAREFAAGQTAEHGGEFIDSAHRRIPALAGELDLTLDDLEVTARKRPGLHPRLYLDGKVRSFADVYRDQDLLTARAAADWRRIGHLRWDRHTRAARALDETTAAEWLDTALPHRSHRLLRLATEQSWPRSTASTSAASARSRCCSPTAPSAPNPMSASTSRAATTSSPGASPNASRPAPRSSTAR
jgi:monoamine oxidase